MKDAWLLWVAIGILVFIVVVFLRWAYAAGYFGPVFERLMA